MRLTFPRTDWMHAAILPAVPLPSGLWRPLAVIRREWLSGLVPMWIPSQQIVLDKGGFLSVSPVLCVSLASSRF